MHFQYASRDEHNLYQGDILARTASLASILQSLYPYAHENPTKYPYFVVLTQSCDLVKYGNAPKAEHLTICAARPIRFFLEQEVARFQPPVLRQVGVCLTKHKTSFLSKIERLLSNEEWPYFYLHPSAETPFTEPHVAYLRITFPLRSDHYDVCLAAKKAQLAPVFQAKLGWLTTLVFGRVATQDFLPEDRSRYANEYIDSIRGIEWRDGKALANEAKRRNLTTKIPTLSEEQLRAILAAVEDKPPSEAAADLIVQHARKLWPDSEEQIEGLRHSLLGDNEFKAAFGR